MERANNISSGKACYVYHEMKGLDIIVLGLSEVRWTGSEVQYERSKLIFLGRDSHERRGGVLSSEEAAGSLKGYWAISERTMLVKLYGTPMDINFTQVYAQTKDVDEAERD